jgi:hypothetical protein
MDGLFTKKQLLSASDRVNLLGNRLVVIAPKARPIKLKIDKSFDFTKVFKVNSVQVIPRVCPWVNMQSRL